LNKQPGQEGVEMTINPILKIIRAKKLGILIRDAREKSGKGNEDIARAMGILPDELRAMELGERAATLPEIEMLAFYLDLPLQHFWENEVLKPDDSELAYSPDEINATRQKAIGELIQQGRTQASHPPACDYTNRGKPQYPYLSWKYW
jgi:transcriptional regulator with XRE-family HTH domain